MANNTVCGVGVAFNCKIGGKKCPTLGGEAPVSLGTCCNFKLLKQLRFALLGRVYRQPKYHTSEFQLKWTEWANSQYQNGLSELTLRTKMDWVSSLSEPKWTEWANSQNQNRAITSKTVMLWSIIERWITPIQWFALFSPLQVCVRNTLCVEIQCTKKHNYHRESSSYTHSQNFIIWLLIERGPCHNFSLQNFVW